jgi:hypothetical protein
MTKPIVAVGMMLLYEDGKWQLDDAVTKFIPEFADLRVMGRDAGAARSPPRTSKAGQDVLLCPRCQQRTIVRQLLPPARAPPQAEGTP